MRKTILITFALLCAVVQGAWADPSGNWTDNGNYSTSWTHVEDNTIYIENAADLARLAYVINSNVESGSGKTYVLTADLDMSAHYWIPIGNATYEFMGSFDGQGHTISGINVNRSDVMYNGLFGFAKTPDFDEGYQTQSIGIRNLKLKSSTINGGSFTGGIVGQASGTVYIQNIICNATVTGNDYVGGIVGYIVTPNNVTSEPKISGCLYNGTSVIATEEGSYDGYIVGWEDIIKDIPSYFKNNLNTKSRTDDAYSKRAYALTVSGLSDNVKMNWVDTEGIADDNTLYVPNGAKMRMGPYCTSADGNSMPTKRITGLSIGNTAVNISPDCLYRYTFNATTDNGNTIYVNSADVSYSGNGTENSPYWITSTDQWNDFANAVTNAGITFEGKYFQFTTNNITVSTMAGMTGRPFCGTFKGSASSGDYFTLTFNCGTAEAPFAEGYCAPFRYINGATIERLKVAGTIHTSSQYASGLVAVANGTNTISNCRSSVIINSTVEGAGNHGGLVACVNEGNLNISDCRFDGNMLGSNTTNCGGFIGNKSNTTSNVTIANSLFSPSEPTVNGSVFVNGSMDNTTITNSFYTANLGNDQGYKSYRTAIKPANIGSRTADHYSISDFAVYQNGLSVDGTDSAPASYYVSSIGLSDNGYTNAELLNELNEQTVGITLTDRTLYKDGAWNTLCLPFDLTIADSQLDGDGVDVRALDNSSFSGGVLTLNFTEEGKVTQLEAGKPYLIKWTSGTNLTNPRFYNVTINQTPGKTETDYIDFIGCYDNGSIYQSGDKTNLYLGANNTLYYPNSSSFNLNAFRGYFQLKGGLTATDDGIIGPNSVRSFVLNFGDDEASGITTTNSTNGTNSDGAWYDLQGRRVATSHLSPLTSHLKKKGIYVHNGKKVIIK